MSKPKQSRPTYKAYRMDILRDADKELKEYYEVTVEPHIRSKFMDRYGVSYPTFSKQVKKAYDNMVANIHSDTAQKFIRRKDEWLIDSKRLIRMTVYECLKIPLRYKHDGDSH